MANSQISRDEMIRGGIDLNQPFQVEYVHRQFPWLSHEEVEKAIKEKGPNRERVISFLQQKRSGEK